MKAFNNFMDATSGCVSYEAPELEMVEISVEHGFELSSEAGFNGPTYGEEDVEW